MSPAETRAEVLAKLEDSLRSGLLFGSLDEPLDDYGKRIVRLILAALATEPPQPASDPPATIHDSPAQRLRWFVRKHALGGCKVLSDPDCRCPLCDVDRLTGAAPQAPPQPASAGTEVEALIEATTERVLRAADLGGLMAVRAIREIIAEARAVPVSAPTPCAAAGRVPARPPVDLEQIAKETTIKVLREYDADYGESMAAREVHNYILAALQRAREEGA